jgi:hypothetical protein
MYLIFYQAKYEYERSIATNMKEDKKIFWKFIQSKTKSKENIPCIMDENGEVQMDNKIKAELNIGYRILLFQVFD